MQHYSSTGTYYGLPSYHANRQIKSERLHMVYPTLLQVSCVGHLIGAVVADTQKKANEAAKLVNIEYEELPAIFSNKGTYCIT